MAAKRGLAGKGPQGLGQAGAQAALGKGVLEEIVGRGRPREIGVAQKVQSRGDDGDLDLEKARLVGGDFFEASGSAANARFR